MATFLFDEIIFGPVFSRRLGISLGVNLLPKGAKFCNFNCVYCECGLTGSKNENYTKTLPDFEEFSTALEDKLIFMQNANKPLKTITFAGNGEPTLHPDFDKIIDKTIELRNQFFPEAKIAVLTNSTKIGEEKIFKSLQKIDQPILKLDSVIENTYQVLNSPPKNYTIKSLTDNFKKFESNFILQTMFVKGFIEGKYIDNTTDEEISEWLNFVKEVRPKQVMIYTIARETPIKELEKISQEKLEEISQLIENLNIETQISG